MAGILPASAMSGPEASYRTSPWEPSKLMNRQLTRIYRTAMTGLKVVGPWRPAIENQFGFNYFLFCRPGLLMLGLDQLHINAANLEKGDHHIKS
jgi:hypothetical protein